MFAGDPGRPGLPGLPGTYTVQIPHRVQKRDAGKHQSNYLIKQKMSGGKKTQLIAHFVSSFSHCRE